MTAQEQSMIDELVERIRTTSVVDKDVQAERHLQQTLGQVPDALYILAQTVLVQQYGLTQAQAQLQAATAELDQLRQQESDSHAAPKSGGSFLSRIFGSNEESPAQNEAQNRSGQGSVGSGYQPVNYAPAAQGGYPPPQGAPGYSGGSYPAPGYGNPGYPPPPYGGPGGPGYGSAGYGGSSFGMPGGGGGGGFLRGALQTAAGVAAGAMVFRGMEDLFQGFGGGERHGLAGDPGETVVNNYYDGDAGAGSRDSSSNDSGFYNPGHDASRENVGDDRGSGDAGGRGFGGFGGFGDDASSNDNAQLADSDNSDAYDDGSTFGDDDSGGQDDFSDDSNS